jgi:hypothetical protein
VRSPSQPAFRQPSVSMSPMSYRSRTPGSPIRVF